MVRRFDVVIERDEEGVYVASVPQLPGCHTDGTSLDELMVEIREAIALYLDVEGHERQVLEGAVNTFQRFKPKCLVEINAYVMIVLNRELPQPLLECIRKMFPYIYKVQRGGKGILEHMPTDDIFWMNHLLTGCCDDLLCSFEELL